MERYELENLKERRPNEKEKLKIRLLETCYLEYFSIFFFILNSTGPWPGPSEEQEQFTTADFTHDLCDKIFWIENNQHF